MTVTDVPIVAIIKRLLDPFLVIGLLWVITLLSGESFSGLYILLAVLTFFVFTHVFDGLKLYESWGRRKPLRHARTLFSAWLVVLALLAFFGYIAGLQGDFSLRVLAIWAIVSPIVLLLVHIAMRRYVSETYSGGNARSVVVVGVNELNIRLSQRINDNPYLFMNIQGYFDDRETERLPKQLPGVLLGKMQNLLSYVQENNTNIIFICLPMSAQPRIVKLLDELRDTTASVYFVPDIYVFDLMQARFDSIQGIPVVSIRETPFLGIESVVKRVSDIVLASIILLLMLPVMVAIAVAIKLTSPGPAIFRQRRYGLNGEEIIVYKFRTMVVSEDGFVVTQAKPGDGRVTPLGRFLRRTSLDELPQFINVLQGRMSIIGPRPHAVAHNELYRKLIKGYMLRHKVRPGITGWAQVNGLRGETDMLELMERRVDFDLDYMRNWSLSLDIWILVRTIWIVVRGDRAY